MAGKIRHLQFVGGRYNARNSVPSELRSVIGKTELLTPLGADRRTAIRDLSRAVAHHQDQLAEARRQLSSQNDPPNRPLTSDEIAQAHYLEELNHDDIERYFEMPESLPIETLNVGDFGLTAKDLENWREKSNRSSFSARRNVLKRIASGKARRDETMASVGWVIDQLRARGATSVEYNSYEERKLAATLASVQLEAMKRVLERDQANFAGTPTFPPLTRSVATTESIQPITIRELFEKHILELNRTGRGKGAQRRWKSSFDHLINFLKHDDATRITRKDVLSWKDVLLQEFAPKSVRDVHLAALKAVLQWGFNNDKLPGNVAIDIKIPSPLKTNSGPKGPNSIEAHALLKKVSAYLPKLSTNPKTRESPQITAAKRWCPWLAAFTGARISELTQLRKEDVLIEDSVNFIRITPDAGQVKTHQYRDVPIHSQLLELGFLDFVGQSKDGPLFYNLSSKRKTGAEHPSKHTAKRVSTWIGSLKVLPKGINPNHGWRHRFKTTGRELKIETVVLNAIQGHSGRTASDDYGEVTLITKRDAMAKFPKYEV